MTLRSGCLLLLLLVTSPAWCQQRPSVRVELLTARNITVEAGRIHQDPIRFRVVRVDTGAPVAGVHVYMSMAILQCLPLLECDFPPPAWYGYWEEAEDPASYDARYTDAYTDARGEVTTPRLIGGSNRWWYEINFSVSALEPYNEVYDNRPLLLVDQVSAAPVAPRAVPGSSPVALALAALAMVLGATRATWSPVPRHCPD